MMSKKGNLFFNFLTEIFEIFSFIGSSSLFFNLIWFKVHIPSARFETQFLFWTRRVSVSQVLYKVYISFVEVGVENVQTVDYFKGVGEFRE